MHEALDEKLAREPAWTVRRVERGRVHHRPTEWLVSGHLTHTLGGCRAPVWRTPKSFPRRYGTLPGRWPTAPELCPSPFRSAVCLISSRRAWRCTIKHPPKTAAPASAVSELQDACTLTLTPITMPCYFQFVALVRNFTSAVAG